MIRIHAENELASLALALIGPGAKLSSTERDYAIVVRRHPDGALVKATRRSIAAGDDPLGGCLTRIRTPEVRRPDGATYTPAPIVESMLAWAASEGTPGRVVDPGAGSGRFLLAAGKLFPKARLVAFEIDPLALLILRANVTARGMADRTVVVAGDFRSAPLPEFDGTTLFVGNPPYVRHHDIEERWKSWFADSAGLYGMKASKLAGLHIHFFLRTMQTARPGDYGAYITSAEWLDVNYGSVLRRLLADGLGGTALHVLDPKAMPFEDAITTGAITCFRVGQRPNALRVRIVKSVSRLGDLSAGTAVPWERVEQATRWSTIVRPGPKVPAGYIELGELCRVHRGQVTGNNDVWISGPHTRDLPRRFLLPTVTKAREILEAGDVLNDNGSLRRVVNLPTDLDGIAPEELGAITRFLEWAKRYNADKSYTAEHRRAWWAVGLKDPAPIICTYMARRPPAFVLNRCKARHINIAHGLYPLEPMPEKLLARLADWLRNNVGVDQGRTYAGGLTKFEPKEVERIPVPRPEILVA
ncbi:MAG: methyltransferase [Candidatus Deferrimicrobium sp.]